MRTTNIMDVLLEELKSTPDVNTIGITPRRLKQIYSILRGVTNVVLVLQLCKFLNIFFSLCNNKTYIFTCKYLY